MLAKFWALGAVVALVIVLGALTPIFDGTLLARAAAEGGPVIPPGRTACPPCYQPRATIRVRLVSPDGPLITEVKADNGGRARIRLVPGVYDVSWHVSARGCHTTTVVLPWRATSATPACQIP
ncbi:MAG TPA: hypothetical protein VHA57_13690 [Actinomycetota bacterium]|nr:hypothetical protein [Actinomycetota bacterium]